jgi:MFS transporter, DHA1 family, multidrug resistance protein
VKPLSIVIYCGVLMSISAFAVDILLPGMPAMVSGLQAPYAAVQWTVTAFVFSAGLAQLVWGPASDRFGRRPVMAVGL